ncbi:hypothetical protein BN1088_1432210 [Sphingobacterium sp. PM2-P1-29]|nr:hypothetical protein BN1088_1432210 [Sphingobacterium sp. PM2-P1-29]
MMRAHPYFAGKSTHLMWIQLIFYTKLFEFYDHSYENRVQGHLFLKRRLLKLI